MHLESFFQTLQIQKNDDLAANAVVLLQNLKDFEQNYFGYIRFLFEYFIFAVTFVNFKIIV